MMVLYDVTYQQGTHTYFQTEVINKSSWQLEELKKCNSYNELKEKSITILDDIKRFDASLSLVHHDAIDVDIEIRYVSVNDLIIISVINFRLVHVVYLI